MHGRGHEDDRSSATHHRQDLLHEEQGRLGVQGKLLTVGLREIFSDQEGGDVAGGIVEATDIVAARGSVSFSVCGSIFGFAV